MFGGMFGGSSRLAKRGDHGGRRPGRWSPKFSAADEERRAMAETGEVIWSRRLRPRWKGIYVVALGLVAVLGLWFGFQDAREDGARQRSAFSDEDDSPSWPLFAGIAASYGFVATLGAWAPQVTLTSTGRLRYRAITRAPDRSTLTARRPRRYLDHVAGDPGRQTRRGRRPGGATSSRSVRPDRRHTRPPARRCRPYHRSERR